MPNWRKVIVSGSDAALNSLNVTSGLIVTGSLNVSGSTTQIGNNTLLGNTLLSGSITISGSSTPGSPTASVQIYGDIRQSGYHRFDTVTTNIDTTTSASYIYVSGSTNDLYFSQNNIGYTNTTRLRWIEGNLYTGLLHGGLITTQSSTVYQIGSGSGIIVDLNASIGDDPYPTIQFLEWPNLSASIAPLTASYQQAFVGIDSTNNIYAQGTPFNNGQFNSIINLGNVLFQNQSTINGVKTQPSVAYGFEQAQNVFNRAFGPLKLSGYTLAVSGSSTGSLIVGSGTAYAPGANYTLDPNDPSYTIDPGTNVSKIFRYYQSGSSWVYLTNAGAGYATIDPTQYSNNGTLASVGGGNWSIQRAFYFPNSVTKAIVVYYGNAIYPTEAEALANLAFESFIEAPNTAANAIYLGAIIINQNGVFTNPNTFTIYPGGLFRQVGGSGGGGSTITTTLAGLSDVSITSPTNGQPLVYNSTSLKWENQSTLTANLVGNASTATTASYALNAGDSVWTGSAGNIYYNGGNVGIGTTNPSSKLNVTSPSNPTIDIGTLNGNTGNAGIQFYSGTGGSNNGFLLQYIKNGSTDRFGFIDGGATERLTILNGGNVGIGTTSPAQKLTVAGNISLTGPSAVYLDGTSTWSAPMLGRDSSTIFLSDFTGVQLGGWNGSSYGPRFTVLGTGNVGIGVTNPGDTLTVNGDISIFSTYKIYNGVASNSAGIYFPSSTTRIDGYNGITFHSSTTTVGSQTERMKISNNGAIKFNAYGSGTFTGTATQKLAVDSSGNVIEIPIGAGPVDGSGTANYITRWSDTDTITTSSIYETGGNIGIGTTSPGSKLHVETSNSNPFRMVRTGDSSYGFELGSGEVGFYNYGTSSYVWLAKANGNIGIGTLTPAYKLSVVGKIDLNDGGNSLFIGTNAGLSDDATANNNIAIGTNSSQNNVSGSQNVAVGHNTLVANTNINNTAVGANALQFNTTALNNTAFGSFALNANTIGSSSIAVGAAALLLSTVGNHNTGVGNSALRSNISGSQNVGVGGSVMFNNANGNDNVALGWNSARYFGTGTSALTDTSGSIFLGTLARANASGEVNQIVIGMNALGLGSNSVVLGNDAITTTVLKGNVGIGTTNPLDKLHVVGNAIVGNSGNISPDSSGNGQLEILGNGYQGYVALDATAMYFGHNSTIRNLTLQTDETDRLTITGAGNVGIGTTTPSALLSGTERVLEISNSNIASLYLDSTTGRRWSMSSISDGTLVFWDLDAVAERMRIDTSGNVGIGTSSPSYKLDVNGQQRITLAGFAGIEYHNTAGTWEVYIGTENNTGNARYNSRQGTHSWYANSTATMTLNASGYLGLGTTSPSYLLDVNGTARVTTLIETSALKYKTNIQPLEPQLSKVTQLEPVMFDWLDKPQTKTNIGLIADEVEKIYPEFVSKTEDGEIEGIEYSKLTTVLIQSIKELKEIVDQQQAQINKLLNKYN